MVEQVKNPIVLGPRERAVLHNLQVWQEASAQSPAIAGVPREDWPPEVRAEHKRLWDEAESRMVPVPEAVEPVEVVVRQLCAGPCD